MSPIILFHFVPLLLLVATSVRDNILMPSVPCGLDFTCVNVPFSLYRVVGGLLDKNLALS